MQPWEIFLRRGKDYERVTLEAEQLLRIIRDFESAEFAVLAHDGYQPIHFDSFRAFVLAASGSALIEMVANDLGDRLESLRRSLFASSKLAAPRNGKHRAGKRLARA